MSLYIVAYLIPGVIIITLLIYRDWEYIREDTQYCGIAYFILCTVAQVILWPICLVIDIDEQITKKRNEK